MDRILEIAGWSAVAIIGAILWIVLPEVRTILACLLTATLVYRVFVAAVRLTAMRIVGDQLMELRSDVGVIAERLDIIDRTTNALFLDTLAHRQAGKLRRVVQSSASKRSHVVH